MKKICDYNIGVGRCTNKAFKEVYPGLLDLKKNFDFAKARTKTSTLFGKKIKVMIGSPFKKNRKFKNRGWSYLCKKHFLSENKRLGEELPSCKA